jgi:hypothetical protein
MKLTAFERMLITRMIEIGQAANVGQLRVALDIIEKVRLTDEDLEVIGFKDDGQVQSWEDGDKTWDIDLSEKDVAVIKSFAMQFRWPVQVGALTLAEKLGL